MTPAAAPMASPGTWELFGAALIVGAIVGGGLKAFGYEIPIIKTYWRQILLFTAGVVAVGYGWQLDKFRVSKIALDVPAKYVGACPTRVAIAGTLRVRGGSGDVKYRLSYDDREFGLRALHFDRSGGEALPLLKIPIEHSGTAEVRLHVLAPDEKESEPHTLAVACRRPPRGFRRYETDGYTTLYPRGWRVVEDDRVRTTFHRTKFAAADSRYWVLIDWSPGIRHFVEPQLASGTAVYVKDRRVALGPHRAHEWQFASDGAKRVDYVFTAGGDNFAVLAEGPDFPAILRVASRIATAITLR